MYLAVKSRPQSDDLWGAQCASGLEVDASASFQTCEFDPLLGRVCSCPARPEKNGGNACVGQKRGIRPEPDPVETVAAGAACDLLR